eukprot:GEMP01031328.1.p1 GENE.GEMP01031328.1~~GEMP01031328.1.p1  ORF type:complete len:381 (+),score=76.26 GEMP01031328.1:133-1275(+)
MPKKRQGAKKAHHGSISKKKKNKENKRNARTGTRMDVSTDVKTVISTGTIKKKNAPMIFARPKGPKGARHITSVTEVKADNMKRIQLIKKAHKCSISQIACANGEIYTCSQDGYLKTWVSKKELGPIALEQKFQQDLGGACWCLLVAGDTIFCGLTDGSIKMFSNGGSSALEGHDKRVTAIVAHEGIIISGSIDSSVKMWQLINGTFACVQTIQMAAEVRQLLVTTTPDAKVLWVGTSTGLFGLDLLNLQLPPVRVVKECTMVVTCLMEYANHVLVGYKDGSLKCFDKKGATKHEMTAYPDCKHMSAFSVVSEGNRLICGFNDGRLSSISLPTFERRARWDAFDHVTTSCVRTCGADGYYLVGSQSGDLQLWQYDDTDDL